MKSLMLLTLLVVLGCGHDDIVGPPGQKGDTGASGVDGIKVNKVVNCSKSQPIGGVALGFMYYLVFYTSGDVFVSCTVSGISSWVHWNTIYTHNQPGALNPLCALNRDVDVASYGWFGFTYSGGTGVATYHDVTSSMDGTVVNLTCTQQDL